MAKNNSYSIWFKSGYLNGYMDAIMRFISQIQDIWNDCIEKDISMRDLCLEETGIDIQQTMEEGA